MFFNKKKLVIKLKLEEDNNNTKKNFKSIIYNYKTSFQRLNPIRIIILISKKQNNNRAKQTNKQTNKTKNPKPIKSAVCAKLS